jgi:hypothetical protein
MLVGAVLLASLLVLGTATNAGATTTAPPARESAVLALGAADRLVVEELQDGTRCVVLIGPNRGGVDCDWRKEGH